jgi:hypothetical protein
VVYLVIIFLVAAMGITRLWLQQRREQTQMDTIEGFSSALEAMSPPTPTPHWRSARAPRRSIPRRSVGGPQRRIRRRNLIQGWFVARPSGAEIGRKVTARRRAEARRIARINELETRRAQAKRAAARFERYAG